MIKTTSFLAILLCLALTIVAGYSYANDGVSQGKDLGYSLIDQARNTVEENAAANTTQVLFDHNNTYFYDKDLSEAQRAGNSKIGNCESILNNQAQYSRKEITECEAIMFAARNSDRRAKYDLDRENDPLLVNSKKMIEDAEISDTDSGTFCRVVRTLQPAVFENKSCMTTLSTGEAKAEICTVDLRGGCDGGGGGVDESMPLTSAVTYSGLNIPHSIQKQPDNLVLSMNPSFTDKSRGYFLATYTFYIKDYASLPKAIFTHGRIDDGIKLLVNGSQVYERNWGGRKELFINPNIDIKSYLKEGKNTVLVNLWNHSGDMGSILNFNIQSAKNCEPTTTCTTRQKNENICTQVSETCLQTDASGVCIKTQKNLMCSDEREWVSECPREELANCGQISSECTNYDASGACVTYNQEYRCETRSEEVTTSTQCEERLCDGENCIGKEAEEDGDFGSAISMLEVQRQAGVYGKQADGSYNIFKGEGGECTVKVLFGSSIMSCCKTIDTGDKFQNRTQGANQTENYGNEPNTPITTTKGSQYVYDEVFDTNKTVAQVQSALTLGWLSCTKDEAALGVKRGSNLCFKTDEECTKETFFGSCLEKTRSYCCFKSTLAKVINTQGRQQLNKGVGCDGFTLEELELLDFSAMDFSEFIDEIVPTDIDVGERKRVVEQSIDNKFQERINYYDQ